MPTIGIDQVPREIVRPKWYSDLGYGGGALARAILLQQLQSGGGIGQVPTSPTPGNPGQLTFPFGATTQTSPLEMAQLQQIGGVPSRQGQITPFGQPSLGGVSYTQPTRLGILPNLERQKTQAEIEKLQGDIQFQKQLPEIYKNIYGQGGGITPEKKKQLEDDVLANVPGAGEAYEYLVNNGLL